jgi:Icc-related predicted phosphoesterase
MSHDTLFITDLHGNLDALRRAVERAAEVSRLRYLILGGDLAPNLITVRLRDGDFVLRHEASYGPKVADDFRTRLREGRRYRAEDQHGKCPVTYTINQESRTVLHLGDDDMKALLEWPSSFGFVRTKQEDFVSTDLLPLLRRYHSEGQEVFAMLGNDDFAELEPLLLAEDRLGHLAYLHGQVRPLGRSQVLGYSGVLSKPFRYRSWERSEEQIGHDLAALTEGRDSTRLLLSIHMPPYGTNLDRLAPDGRHAGSQAIRALLERRRFGIGLFGHIHESHHFSSSRHDRVGGTLVINPGGYHASECCAVIFDSSDPEDWRGLWEYP